MDRKDKEKNLVIIGKIYTEFVDKFGIPRQSGLVKTLRGEIVFEPEFRSLDALKGIEEFSHLWLIFGFSRVNQTHVSLTVAPPRLGGKEKRGVFATRAPYRPNGLGLSSVRIEEIYMDEKRGPILVVSGADLLNETPIYDIKPYLPYTDSHPDAKGGFGEAHKDDQINVVFPSALLKILPEHLRVSAVDVLKQDPRAAYNKKENYVYGMRFGDYDIRFIVKENILTVQDVIEVQNSNITKIK